MHFLPLALTGTRAALAPVMIGLALWSPDPVLFGVCLVVAFLSDVFDGIIARRLQIATPALRRLDSIADSLFYLATCWAGWYVLPAGITDYLPALGVLLGLELIRYGVDFRKFGKEASYHMWSSKLWGITRFGVWSHARVGTRRFHPICRGSGGTGLDGPHAEHVAQHASAPRLTRMDGCSGIDRGFAAHTERNAATA